MREGITYPGQELELFKEAHNWKKYFASVIRPFIHGDVLENGAGIGGTTLLLHSPAANSWVLAEPDHSMADQLTQMIRENILPANCRVHAGTIDSIKEDFDCIIYIDVLEHIEEDRLELEKAAAHLRTGGYLIVLSPAFRILYSPFDKAIGHFRRYSKTDLKCITPQGLKIELLRYYDSAGFFAGLMNRMLLRQKYPTKKQVRFWDRFLIPISKFTDRVLFHSFGKAVICTWKKSST